MSDGSKEQDSNEKDIRVRDKPEYRENEWSDLSLDNFLKIMEKDQWSSLDTFLENMEKEAEKEEVRKWNESVDRVVEAQFTGLIVPPLDNKWDK